VLPCENESKIIYLFYSFDRVNYGNRRIARKAVMSDEVMEMAVSQAFRKTGEDFYLSSI